MPSNDRYMSWPMLKSKYDISWGEFLNLAREVDIPSVALVNTVYFDFASVLNRLGELS